MTQLVDAIGSASLFGGPRQVLLTNLAATSPALEVLETYAKSSDAVVLASFTGRSSPKAISRLEALGKVTKIASPSKEADSVSQLLELAALSKVSLDADTATALVNRLDGDWARAQSIITQLDLAELHHPTASQVLTLAGSKASAPVPWTITEAAAARRPHDALAAACKLEPVVLASWVGGETLRLAAIVEGSLSKEQAASQLSIHPFRAGKLVTWAKRITPAQLGEMIRAAALLELAAKDSPAAERSLAALATWLSAAGC